MMKKLLLTIAVSILLTASTIAQVPSYVSTNGLVGWWPFNGNANDESGNGNNGTVYGATPTSDRYGFANSAYSFSNSKIKMPKINLNSTSGFTVSAWFYLTTTTPTSMLVSIGPDNTNNTARMMYHQGNLRGAINSWLQLEQIETSYNSTMIYTHVTFVVSSSSLKIYKNGILENTLTGSFVTSTNDDLYFGYSNMNGFPYFLYGSLDDIGIWNRSLTQQEITDLYNGCKLSVNTQPTNKVVNINKNAQFVVSSSDTGASFRWQTDLGVGFQNLNSVGQYSGASSDTLNVANVTMSNNNQPLRCIVSSGLCSDTSNVAVLTVKNNVGVNEFKQNNLFSVYPNPTKGVVFIEVKASLLGSNYIVYSSNGAEVLSGSVTTEVTTLGIQDFAEGVYFIQLGEDIKQSFKILKQ